MSGIYKHPKPDLYEVVWRNGHVDRFLASQVTYPNNGIRILRGRDDLPDVVEFHGEIDGHWRLQLRADVADIRTIRNVTTTEAELS